MTSKEDYNDFSALDAAEHLTHALKYCFENHKHKYKFGLAKKHNDNISQNNNFNDSKRLFKIVMGTYLVTNKQITSYKTPQGYRYLFKKDFLQQVQ